MVKDYMTVWGNCLLWIKDNLASQSFKTWFQPIKPISLSQNVLTIQVPNKFFYEMLEEHYVHLLKKAIQRELGENGTLEYQILVPQHEFKSQQKYSLHNVAVTSNGYDEEIVPEIRNPFVIPGVKKLKVESQLNTKYSFDNYIEGDCNRLARSAGMAVAQKPGGTSFNPLVIYGDVGLGKTHLAQAIGNAIPLSNPDMSVLYVSAEKFTNQIIQAIKNNSINDFVNFYQLIDTLIIDDIQFLANKHKTQEIFFHIFNQLHQNGKQLILTSDRPPKDLDGMQDRLISRFKWGLTADLQVPDLETRIAILSDKMGHEGTEVPYEVLEYICYNVKENIRELEGVLISIIAQASLNNRKVDVSLTREVIQQFVDNTSRKITVESIKDLVAEHFQMETDMLESNSRKRQIVVARQLAMFLAKKMTTNSLKNIGNHFGGRDHSTVIYSCKVVQDQIDTDSEFESTVAELEKNISMILV